MVMTVDLGVTIFSIWLNNSKVVMQIVQLNFIFFHFSDFDVEKSRLLTTCCETYSVRFYSKLLAFSMTESVLNYRCLTPVKLLETTAMTENDSNYRCDTKHQFTSHRCNCLL